MSKKEQDIGLEGSLFEAEEGVEVEPLGYRLYIAIYKMRRTA